MSHELCCAAALMVGGEGTQSLEGRDKDTA